MHIRRRRKLASYNRTHVETLAEVFSAETQQRDTKIPTLCFGRQKGTSTLYTKKYVGFTSPRSIACRRALWNHWEGLRVPNMKNEAINIYTWSSNQIRSSYIILLLCYIIRITHSAWSPTINNIGATKTTQFGGTSAQNSHRRATNKL